jgi:hypothetical protein
MLAAGRLGLPFAAPGAGLSRVLSVLLVVLTIGSLLPSPVAAQPTVDPAAIALTPADLPPGFTVVPEQTGTAPLGTARGVAFRQLMRREATEANLSSGPISVAQVILRVDEPVSFSGFLDRIRQDAIANEGFTLVPGAPNDGGTASLMKREGDLAAYEVGFIKANFVVFTRWVGLATVVNLPGVLTLAGVSSGRYDAVLAGQAPPTAAPPAPPSPAAPPPTAAPPSPPPNPADGAAATPDASGWATVVQVGGPEILMVQNAAGQQFIVWHIGIIGPHASQEPYRQQATAFHAQRLPPGTRVWLEAQSGLQNPTPEVALRHVLRDADPAKPVAAELLQAGAVWVFPHTIHAYVDGYADRQAEAVLARAGGWAQTRSSEIFKPRGVERGGFPIDPRVRPALQALDADNLGNTVLKAVNAFPVEIGISPNRQGAIAAFIPRYYTVQLGEEIMSASPQSIAAVLIHELLHARQMIEGQLSGEEIDCYEGEIEAFEAAAQYWFGVHGAGGKARPTHPLDNELNETLREVATNTIRTRVYQSYGHQCGAAWLPR